MRCGRSRASRTVCKAAAQVDIGCTTLDPCTLLALPHVNFAPAHACRAPRCPALPAAWQPRTPGLLRLSCSYTLLSSQNCCSCGSRTTELARMSNAVCGRLTVLLYTPAGCVGAARRREQARRDEPACRPGQRRLRAGEPCPVRATRCRPQPHPAAARTLFRVLLAPALGGQAAQGHAAHCRGARRQAMPRRPQCRRRSQPQAAEHAAAGSLTAAARLQVKEQGAHGRWAGARACVQAAAAAAAPQEYHGLRDGAACKQLTCSPDDVALSCGAASLIEEGGGGGVDAASPVLLWRPGKNLGQLRCDI